MLIFNQTINVFYDVYEFSIYNLYNIKQLFLNVSFSCRAEERRLKLPPLNLHSIQNTWERRQKKNGKLSLLSVAFLSCSNGKQWKRVSTAYHFVKALQCFIIEISKDHSTGLYLLKGWNKQIQFNKTHSNTHSQALKIHKIDRQWFITWNLS